jgi:hypothetical protein
MHIRNTLLARLKGELQVGICERLTRSLYPCSALHMQPVSFDMRCFLHAGLGSYSDTCSILPG